MSSLSGVTTIPFELIKEITGDFSEEKRIGSGGYGEVYKGVLNNGDEIAIKRLFSIHGLDAQTFEDEFNSHMRVRHDNIIRLIGYCCDTKNVPTKLHGKFVFADVTNRCLCFEYMQGGNLDEHISDESCIHDWPTTYRIIKGICQGLHYLHKGLDENKGIYHLDLKPANILLDTKMVPKIGDFGLARLYGTSKTIQTNKVAGTTGFMSPEFIQNGTISAKNDVFSLGVIIFHIMAGKKAYTDYWELRQSNKEFSDKSRQELIESVQEHWGKKMQATVGYTWGETDILGVKKCIQIAMSCVEIDRKKRPSTENIIHDLNELDAKIKNSSRKDPLSHVGQLKKDIMIDPSREVRFPFEPKRDVSCCLQLTNKAACFIAFSIEINPNKYRTHPYKGIMPPCTMCYITITSPAQEKAPLLCREDVFIVQSTRVNQDFTAEQITEDFLAAAVDDELILPIVFV
ncbi:hypothetical protein BS78_07G159200 [Paspalum vaginatum]|nr:hypothetical protein BS78_07G159200 [Paspalum vaginatum]KAJ1268756.1 hypothetical protein BS78_07G159200 [Paspalum vaginatum]KAJ1268757.1 hypothetical protein BS78_07G159200 [Paspalum vaginatum]